MLVDLLSTSNYISFNIKVAQVLGLHTAIYLAELTNINEKAIRKNKVVDDYFCIDRKYLTSRTTLNESEQKDIEKELLAIGVLVKSEKDDCSIRLNIDTLTSMLMSSDEKLIKAVGKIVRSKSAKRTKTEIRLDQLRALIASNNPDLRDAYTLWIKSVLDKEGWMSDMAVTSAQKVVDDFSKRNLDLALELINIAAINGYRDMTWALNKYNTENKNKLIFKPKDNIINQNVELSKEGF